MSTIAGILASPPEEHGYLRRYPPRDVRLTRTLTSSVQGGSVRQVVLLSLEESAAPPAAGHAPRVPLLTCADVLREGGVGVDFVTAGSDAEIDAAVKPVRAGEA